MTNEPIKAQITGFTFDETFKLYKYDWSAITNKRATTKDTNNFDIFGIKSAKAIPMSQAVCIEEIGLTLTSKDSPSVDIGDNVIMFPNQKNYFFSKGGGVDLGTVLPPKNYCPVDRDKYSWANAKSSILPQFLYLDASDKINEFSDGRVNKFIVNITMLPKNEVVPDSYKVYSTDTSIVSVDYIFGTGTALITAKSAGSCVLVFTTKSQTYHDNIYIHVRSNSEDYSEFNGETLKQISSLWITSIPILDKLETATSIEVTSDFLLKNYPVKIENVVKLAYDGENDQYYEYYRELHFTSNGILGFISEVKRRDGFKTTLHNS